MTISTRTYSYLPLYVWQKFYSVHCRRITETSCLGHEPWILGWRNLTAFLLPMHLSSLFVFLSLYRKAVAALYLHTYIIEWNIAKIHRNVIIKTVKMRIRFWIQYFLFLRLIICRWKLGSIKCIRSFTNMQNIKIFLTRDINEDNIKKKSAAPILKFPGNIMIVAISCDKVLKIARIVPLII